jgi:RNA polymerase sigma-70 factor (ECF subfamily)
MRTGTRHEKVEKLLEQIRAGDPRAFGRLIRELEPFVRGASMKVCRDRAVADENAQDTYVALHRKLDQFAGASSFTTWLYSVIVNNCRMKHRRRLVVRASVELDESTRAAGAWDAAPEARLLGEELQQILGRAIERLPQEYQAVFVLRQIERLSTDETAQELGLSPSAVKSRLHRARTQVRRDVEAHYADARP